jgi:prepilin-type N-terminal cleavage/methylation domain-containing protein
MSIKTVQLSKSAYTLVEMMMAVGVFSIAALALATIFMFSVRSYAAMANYAVLDQYNRQAMDQLTYEIRQAQRVLDYSSNATTRSLSILNGSGTTVTYTFDSSRQAVIRNASDGTAKMLLTNCNLLDFGLYMRPPTNGTFDVYPVSIGSGSNWQSLVKVIQLSWKTSMNICPTMVVNSEDIQTARIVIRKQQDN